MTSLKSALRPASRPVRLGKLVALIVVGLFVAGCFGTKFALGPAAPVEKAFVGQWQLTDPDGNPCQLLVRNIDGKQYYLEFAEQGKAPNRYVAFLSDVKGAKFANIKRLTDDGELPESYSYMRVELKDGKLIIRDLNDEFFKDKPLDSPEQVRAAIEQNLENPQMYKSALTGTREPS